jgi:hypothetical protein
MGTQSEPNSRRASLSNTRPDVPFPRLEAWGGVSSGVPLRHGRLNSLRHGRALDVDHPELDGEDAPAIGTATSMRHVQTSRSRRRGGRAIRERTTPSAVRKMQPRMARSIDVRNRRSERSFVSGSLTKAWLGARLRNLIGRWTMSDARSEPWLWRNAKPRAASVQGGANRRRTTMPSGRMASWRVPRPARRRAHDLHPGARRRRTAAPCRPRRWSPIRRPALR